jgi:hypothetical protein
MITTIFGSEMKIIKGDLEKGIAMVKRVEDGKILTLDLINLRANGGFAEIEKEIIKGKINGI